MNGDWEIRDLIKVFRFERRAVLGDASVDLSTLRNCCQILIDEIDELARKKLGKDWGKYQKALSFFKECMKDADYESLSEEA